MNKKQFERQMKNLGVIVAPGSAKYWPQSRQHTENWNYGKAGKRVAFSVFSNGYKAWIEPRKSFEDWDEAFSDYVYKNLI